LELLAIVRYLLISLHSILRREAGRTSLCETFDYICFITHQPQQTHDLLSTSSNSTISNLSLKQKKIDIPSQHIALLGILDYQDQLIDTIDFVFDTLNQRTESIGDIINKGVRDPVGCYGDVIFELLNSASHILGVGCTSEVELLISH
jgi:hypothetical protein